MARALTIEDKKLIEARIVAEIDQNPRLTMTRAAEIAGISRGKLYQLLNDDRGFADRIQRTQTQARSVAVDSIEEALYDRALDPKNPAGVTAGIFLLKGNRPEIYGEKSAPMTGTVINIGALTIIPSQAPTELPRAIEIAEMPTKGTRR
jgi:hypothetical protein